MANAKKESPCCNRAGGLYTICLSKGQLLMIRRTVIIDRDEVKQENDLRDAMR